MPTTTDEPPTTPSRATVSRGPFFIGEMPLTVDDKGRLLVPAEVRRQMERGDESTFIILRGKNHQIWLYPERYYEERVAPESDDPVPDDDELDYMLTVLGQASRLTPDKAGRVVLPEGTVDRKQLGREVMLVGVRNHLQLWNRQDYLEYRETKDRQRAEIADRYKAVKDRRRAAG
ncbi:MAG: hypothetical protein AAGI46_05225 [Planctomycetota bacterium]